MENKGYKSEEESLAADEFNRQQAEKLGNVEQKETKKISAKVCCLDGFHSMPQLLEALYEASDRYPVETYLLAEYGVNLDEFLQGLDKVKEFASHTSSAIIAAPEGRHEVIEEDGEAGLKTFSWLEAKQMMDGQGIPYEDALSDDDSLDSVGFYISQDQTYAFPKTMRAEEPNPAHVIPGTKVGVIICGEIHCVERLEPELVDQVDVLYNPSKEGDDPYLKYRMMRVYGNCSPEQIREEIMRDNPYISVEQSNTHLAAQISEGEIEYLRGRGLWDADEGENKAEWEARIERILEKSLQGEATSRYARAIPEAIKTSVPIVRTDGRTTGLLNEVPGLKFRHLQYDRGVAGYCFMDFEFSKTRDAQEREENEL